MSTIFVTNNSDKILKDGFCGQFWTFKIGETVELHEDAAQSRRQRTFFGTARMD